ncbi:MAG: hypothetical protein AB1405_03675 [Bdellovibrionota bacterium]
MSQEKLCSRCKKTPAAPKHRWCNLCKTSWNHEQRVLRRHKNKLNRIRAGSWLRINVREIRQKRECSTGNNAVKQGKAA